MLKLYDGNKEVDMKPSCTVKMGDEVNRLSNFIVVGSNEENTATLLSYADPYLLGVAMKLVTKEFFEQLHNLPEDLQVELKEVLGL